MNKDLRYLAYSCWGLLAFLCFLPLLGAVLTGLKRGVNQRGNGKPQTRKAGDERWKRLIPVIVVPKTNGQCLMIALSAERVIRNTSCRDIHTARYSMQRRRAL